MEDVMENVKAKAMPATYSSLTKLGLRSLKKQAKKAVLPNLDASCKKETEHIYWISNGFCVDHTGCIVGYNRTNKNFASAIEIRPNYVPDAPWTKIVQKSSSSFRYPRVVFGNKKYYWLNQSTCLNGMDDFCELISVKQYDSKPFGLFRHAETPCFDFLQNLYTLATEHATQQEIDSLQKMILLAENAHEKAYTESELERIQQNRIKNQKSKTIVYDDIYGEDNDWGEISEFDGVENENKCAQIQM